MSLNYDTIVYIDSDCIFLNQRERIETFIDKTPIRAGIPFHASCMGFLKNAPYDDAVPCSGFIILRNCKLASLFLNTWWNFSNEDTNFHHDFEQASLHKIFPSHRDILCVLDAVFFIEQEGQFLRHITGQTREPYFRRVVGKLEADGRGSFADVVAEIRAHRLHPLSTPSVKWTRACAEAELAAVHTELAAVYASRSWRITSPLRSLGQMVKKHLSHGRVGAAPKKFRVISEEEEALLKAETR